MRRIDRIFFGIALCGLAAMGDEPKVYECPRSTGPIKIDGLMDDAAWRA